MHMSPSNTVFLIQQININSMASLIPFSGVMPVRIVGASASLPFCSVVSDGKLLYSAGAHLVLENTHTNEQRIFYTHRLPGRIELIVHQVTLYNEHLVAVVIRDETSFMRSVEIVPLNTSMLNLERDQKDRKSLQLKHLQDFQVVQALQFFEEGTFIGVISIYQQLSNFSLLKATNAEPIFKQSFLRTRILLSSTSLCKQNYISLLLLDQRDGTRLCLLATDELSRRLFFTLRLESSQTILQYCFEPSHEQGVLLIALTSHGYVLIFKVNEYEALLQARINVKWHRHDLKLASSAQHLRPSLMQTSGNKIVVAYAESKAITLIQYSVFNPSSYHEVTLHEALQPYSQISSTHSMRISRDGCTLAVLFRLNTQSNLSGILSHTPSTMKELPDSAPSQEQLTQKDIHQARTNKEFPQSQKQQFMALQIDLLSNTIDHTQKNLSVGQTLSTCAGQAPVTKVEYCSHSNTLFLLLANQVIKYYDLTPNPNSRGKPEFRPGSLLLWAQTLTEQAESLAAHPLNFSVLLLYKDIIKLHYYNCKCLFPAFIVSPIQNVKHAVFSPLGDKLVLAANNCLTVIDAYTFRTLNSIGLPNIQLQTSLVSEHSNAEPKSINKVLFVGNDRLVVLSGYNTLSMVEGLERSVHFGFVEEKKGKKQIVFDSTNQLAVVAEGDTVLVLSKASLNSNSKCEVIAKMQISASALLALPELGVFFLGTTNGSVYLIQWPNYSAEDLYLHESHRTELFDEPVTALFASPSMQYLYAVSASGAIAICELKVAEGESIPSKFKEQLLKLADVPLKKNERWLISRSQEERKERELIKLRGEEADSANNHSHLEREHTLLEQNLVFAQRKQLEQGYVREIKDYESKLGLQKVLQQISLLKDEYKLIRRRRQREVAELHENNGHELNKLFEERRKLQFDLSERREVCVIQKQSLKQSLKEELAFLVEDFENQSNIIHQRHQEAHAESAKTDELFRIKNGEADESFDQDYLLMKAQFEREKQKLMEEGQTILSKNRNTHVASFCLQDKMGELGLQKEKVQYDLIRIESEKEQLQCMQKKLQKSLENTNLSYNRLIKQTRDLEEQLLQQRRISAKLIRDLTEINKDLAELEEKATNLDSTYFQLSDDFIKQKDQLQESQASLNSMTSKIQALRTRKKDKEYKKCLAKARLQQAVSTLARELDADPVTTVSRLREQLQKDRELIQESQLSGEFQERKASFDKMARHALKWRALKDAYFGGFRRSYYKLNEENLKLTYQYNDLFKVAQEYRTNIIDLQERIDVAKKCRQQSTSLIEPSKESGIYRRGESQLRIRWTLFGKARDLNAQKGSRKGMLTKKGVCVSLHQETGKFITEA